MARYSGYEVDYEGDAFFYTFASAPDAVAAVSEAMAGLEAGPISIRVGIHTGIPALDPPKYVGLDVHFGSAGDELGATAARSSARPRLPTLVDVSSSPSSASTGSRTSQRRSPSSSSARAPSLRSRRSRTRTCPARRAPSSGERQSSRRLSRRIEQGARLVTLTGPGGTGKTRLALEAASTLVPEYKAGVFWVGLASLRDPALVTETIAQTLGAKDDLASHIARARAPASARQPGAGDRGRTRALGPPAGLSQPHPPRHLARAPARRRERSSTPCPRSPSPRPSPSSASAPASSPPRRSPSCAPASTISRSPSSSPPRARRCSRRPRSSSASRSGSTCSRAAATPIPASRPCARPSSGATTSSTGRAAALRAPLRLRRRLHTRSRRGGRRRRPRHPAVARREEPPALHQRRATGCSRRSGSTRPSDSTTSWPDPGAPRSVTPSSYLSLAERAERERSEAASAEPLQRLADEHDNVRLALSCFVGRRRVRLCTAARVRARRLLGRARRALGSAGARRRCSRDAGRPVPCVASEGARDRDRTSQEIRVTSRVPGVLRGESCIVPRAGRSARRRACAP